MTKRVIKSSSCMRLPKLLQQNALKKFQCLTYLTKHVAPLCASQPKMLLLSCNVCDRVWDNKTCCIVSRCKITILSSNLSPNDIGPKFSFFLSEVWTINYLTLFVGEIDSLHFVVWGELQVAAGCGGSPAYAPRNRFPVVGMRYGPLPLFNHSTPIDPPSRQSLRALSYPTVRDVTNELMGGLVNSLMITVRT